MRHKRQQSLVLLDAERKTVVVSYAVVEAALGLIPDFTSLADAKYIGTTRPLPYTAQTVED